jgi:hypothetical protein
MATIADLAVLVRSKNAGPFWLTICAVAPSAVPPVSTPAEGSI